MAGSERRRPKAGSRTKASQTLSRPNPATPNGVAQALVAIVLLGVAGWMVYGRSLSYPFIFDDFHSVVMNPSITRLWPLFGASSPFVAPFDSPTAGRPLVNLSLAMNYHFGQIDPWGYHFVNLTLHVLSAVLLWAIVQRTLQLPYFANRFDRAAFGLSLLVALAWLVHPLVTESVEYTTQRTELMMGLFYLATLFTSLRYFTATTSKHQLLWLLLAGVACAAGMACKETMVSAPFAVLLFERTFLARSFWRALRRSWPLYVALALGWIVLLTLNLGGPRSASAGFHRGIPAHVWWFTQAKVLAMYFKLSFWPWPLSVHYRVPLLETFAVAWPWLVFALLLGIGILIALGRRSAAGFIGACAVMILAPTLAVPILKEVAVERRMYLPLAAILTLTIVGGYRLLCSVAQVPASNEPKIFRWPLAATLTFGAILVVVMGAVSSLRLTAYRDAVTLWQDAARRDPNDLIAIQNTGIALNDAQRSEEAARYMRQALERFPDWPEGYHVLGVALINLQRPAEAIDYLEKSFPSPDDTLAHFHLGLALLNAGRPVEAIDQFEMVVQEQPDVSTFQNRLGMALFLAGRPQPALEHFRKAVALEPDSAMIRKNLALTLKAVNSLPEAREEFEKTIRLAPDDLDARAQLAIVYNDLGQSADAVATAEKALAMARAAGNVPLTQSLENWLKQNRK